MMSVSPENITKTIRQVTLGTLLIFVIMESSEASDIQFNTDVMDIADRDNIDLSRFSRKGFILPGKYTLRLNINSVALAEREIVFYAPENDPEGSVACLTQEMVEQFGLTKDALKKLIWSPQNQCMDLASLPGLELTPNLATSSLMINLPQAWLEYNSPDWDPPSRWEEGIGGVLLDYSLYAQSRFQPRGQDTQNLSGNGVLGANFGAWRFRADWQGSYDRQGASRDGKNHNLDVSRYYAYRALPQISSRLILGEDFLNTNLFDSFRFAGVTMMSDPNMRPPMLQGYAPEVSGVARTNARVTISQQGRIIKDISVAAGPFRIQDLNSAVNGELDVTVEESDGSVQKFKVDTASVPYLTRPGQVNYKTAIGRPSAIDHRSDGPLFAMGEFSWGVRNGWSLLGGAIVSGNYKAINTGAGRDLFSFGAVSFDVTQSFAQLPDSKTTMSGKSYRFNYSKEFESLDNDIQLGAYRFSDNNFLSMGEFLDYSQGHNRSGRSKETYTIISRQRLRSLGATLSLNYNRHNYWDRPSEHRYSLNVGRTFDIGPFRDVYVNVYAQRNKSSQQRDDSINLTVSLPFGRSANISYDGYFSREQTGNGVSYYDRRDNGDSYRLGTRVNDKTTSFDGSYSHANTIAQFNASASYSSDRYSTASVSMNGGATLTAEGGALHRAGMMGGTRLLIDTDGVANVPVRGFGQPVYSNSFGKIVVGNVNSYYRNTVSVDMDKLADNAEVVQSVVQGTLTEGAIGYRKFDVIEGQKIMAVVRTVEGTHPPFGATVVNDKGQETGIITDEGALYLTGINPEQKMQVRWGDNQQCDMQFPATLPKELGTVVPVTCRRSIPADPAK